MEPAAYQLIEPGELIVVRGHAPPTVATFESDAEQRRYVIVPNILAGCIFKIPPDCGFVGMVLGTVRFGELNADILDSVDLMFNTPLEQRTFDDSGTCYVLCVIKSEAGQVSLWQWRGKIVIVPLEYPFIEVSRF